MEDSWDYIWAKSHDLLNAVFLLNGSLGNRLKQAESNSLIYLFGRNPPDPTLKEKFNRMDARWREIRDEQDELEISDFGRDLLSLFWEIDQKFIESKSNS